MFLSQNRTARPIRLKLKSRRLKVALQKVKISCQQAVRLFTYRTTLV